MKRTIVIAYNCFDVDGIDVISKIFQFDDVITVQVDKAPAPNQAIIFPPGDAPTGSSGLECARLRAEYAKKQITVKYDFLLAPVGELQIRTGDWGTYVYRIHLEDHNGHLYSGHSYVGGVNPKHCDQVVAAIKDDYPYRMLGSPDTIHPKYEVDGGNWKDALSSAVRDALEKYKQAQLNRVENCLTSAPLQEILFSQLEQYLTDRYLIPKKANETRPWIIGIGELGAAVGAALAYNLNIPFGLDTAPLTGACIVIITKLGNSELQTRLDKLNDRADVKAVITLDPLGIECDDD